MMEPTEELEAPFREDVLDPLLGSTRDEVIERLGKPTFLVKDGSKTYFVYSRFVDSAGIGLMFGVPVPLSRYAWVCSRLEFSGEQRLERFDTSVTSYEPLRRQNCKRAYWSENEFAALEQAFIADIEVRAHEGDPEAMFEYASLLNDAKSSWKWHCLAAHQGSTGAQHQLGNYFHRGYYPASRDVVRAYLWHSLAQDNEEPAQIEGITPAQIAKAKDLVANWKPDPAECDTELDKAKLKAIAASVTGKTAGENHSLPVDPEEMYEYATSLGFFDGWNWYCRAAHLGIVKARYVMGNYYRWGYAHVTKDLVRANLWYWLSGSTALNVSAMSPDQIAEYERLLTRWEPNSTECDLEIIKSEG